MTVLWVGFTLLLAYIYVGYPVLLSILGRFFPRPYTKDESYEPSVTLIISAYNEEKVILGKLENALQLEYPIDKLTILVVSDKSTDKTDQIVHSFNEHGVILLRSENRRGKTAGLNNAMEEVKSDLVVFSDANALYQPNAIQKLVRHFADEHVGFVVGHAKYESYKDSAAGRSEGAYWNLEILQKTLESNFSSVVGGDGAIYAIRRHLWEPLQDTDINDFVNPLQITARGFRGCFDPEAVCFEHPAGEFQREFGRKVRIVNRSFNGVLRVPQALNIFKNARFAWQLISHKLLRWFSPYFIAVHFILTLGMAVGPERGLLSFLFLTLYGATAFLALLGYRQDRKGIHSSKFLFIPQYFYLMNIAAALGVWLRFRGVIITTWETVREKPSQESGFSKYIPFILSVIISVSFLGCIAWLGKGWMVLHLIAYGIMGILSFGYLGYPLVLGILVKFFPISSGQSERHLPSVTLLISAYNEAGVIKEKLCNSLSIDYPTDRLNIVVASDGSTDRTNGIVAEFFCRGVELIQHDINKGKISAICQALEGIHSELIVFSDANVMYEPQAIRKLVRHFHDPHVGGVSGKVVLVNDTISYAFGENSYYGVEHFIHEKEGATGAMIGAEGAMYAIRRSLFRPPPRDTILDDFAISMGILSQGYRVLFEKEALGFEKNTLEIKGEFHRKSRIVAGGIQYIMHGQWIPALCNPFLMLKFISHKLLRWVSGPLVVLLFFLSIIAQIAGRSDYFLTLVLYGMIVSMSISGMAQLFPAFRKLALINLMHYFFMVKLASLVGCYKGITGSQKVTWRK